jgi:hypothetical protein
LTLASFHEACRTLDGETDPRLGSYITATTSLTNLAHPDSSQVIAVGLKGVGKSSAFRYLTDFDLKRDIVVAINPDSFELSLPSRRFNYAACRKQFEQDVVIEALRAIDSNASQLASRCGKALLIQARKHVKSYLEAIKGAAGQVRGLGISILGCGFTISRGEAPTAIGLIPRQEVADALATLKAICQQGVKVRIVVDDPELVFSASQDLDMHLLGGFCLAALRLSVAIKGFKVVALLKTHVYHPVRESIEDLSKYPDHTTRLAWTDDELLSLVERRLKATAVRWSDVFDGGEQEGRALIQYMVGLLRNGPRDLLRWFDLALQQSAGRKLQRSHIVDTFDKLSRDSLKEMESAHFVRYEKLGSVVRAIFSSKPGKDFTRQELLDHLQTVLVKDRRIKSLSGLDWMQRESSDSLPQTLFEVGALALRAKSRLILPYHPDYDQDAFEGADRFVLVPGLAAAVTTS